MQFYNTTIILSLINLGFFGGFTHCSGMCGPFVLTQVSNRLQNTPLEKFSTFSKMRNLALIPYHLGRITTYSFIGFFCSAITKNLQNFKHVSGALLIIAAFIFLKNILNFKLPFKPRKSSFLKIKTPEILKKLFANPQGFNGYLLGIILGFIPCGLLYAAFVLSASLANPILASFAMFLFGIMTFPSLFLIASSSYLFLKITNLKLVSKIVILINAASLMFMGINLILS